MPSYTWFLTRKIDIDQVPAKIRTLQSLGVPYPDGFDEKAVDALRDQATGIATGLQNSGFDVEWDAHMVAVIAYLQRLGTDIKGDAQANTFNKFVEPGSSQQAINE